MALTRKIVNGAAIDYLLHSLRERDLFLQAVSNCVAKEQGSIFTFVNETVAHQVVTDFIRGGQANQGNSQRLVSEYLCEHFTEGKNILLVENHTALPEDGWLSNPGMPSTLFYKRFAYHYTWLSSVSPEQVKNVINAGASSAPHVIGIVAKASLELSQILNSHRPLLNDNDILPLAQTVMAVVVGAFDGEGYLIWTK